jgi:hypothetical protein
MKTTILKVILFSAFILVLAGCKKSNVISERQKILFQFEYVNYAWGYRHTGFIIDSQGNVLTYENPENWNFLDDNHSISGNMVSENLKKCSPSGIKITPEELQKYAGYIKNIASTKISALKNVAADAGSYEYFCFQYSETTESYKGYLIKMEGDFTCENLNFYSKKVAAWMKDINSNFIKN